MPAPVVYTAACPTCNGDATWSSTPLVQKLLLLRDAHPTTIPEISISCPTCDKKPKRGSK